LQDEVLTFSIEKMETKPHFTPGVKVDVQLKSSISIGAKVEISPKA
jgi:hypothetical protein